MIGRLFSISLFIVLLGILFCLVRLTYTTYGDMLAVRLKPAQDNFFTQDNSKLMASKKELRRLVLFGDSRIAMWKDLLEADGYQVINRGIGGETTAQALLRLDTDVIAINADAVVIQVGINDLKSIAFIKNREDEILQTTKQNILEVVGVLRQKRVKVYLMTILPAAKPVGLWRFLWTKKIDNAVSSVNSFIRTMDGDLVSVIDCEPMFNDGAKLKPDYSLDTLHLNNEGYSLLTNIVKNFVKQQTLSIDGIP